MMVLLFPYESYIFVAGLVQIVNMCSPIITAANFIHYALQFINSNTYFLAQYGSIALL